MGMGSHSCDIFGIHLLYSIFKTKLFPVETFDMEAGWSNEVYVRGIVFGCDLFALVCV